jgi:hypothetical protein
MTERETLLAEIAEKQARLAELDAEPDWEPAEKAFLIAYAQHHGTGDATKAALIAAFAKAPPMGSGMELAECPTLTREMVREAVEIADVQAMGVKEYVDTLHAALVERIRAFQTGEQP